MDNKAILQIINKLRLNNKPHNAKDTLAGHTMNMSNV